MSPRPGPQQSVQWITAQIDAMSQLRNATTRDPGFRQWRQNTLTVLQRIWPGDAARAQRFRRVPFAPPSARASEQEARDCYERGYAEARTLLKLWLVEARHGAASAAALMAAAEAQALAPAAPAEPRRPPRGKAPAVRPRSRAQLKDILGLGELGVERSKGGGTPPTRRRKAVPTAAPLATPRPEPPVSVTRRRATPRPADGLARSIADAIERAGHDAPAAGELAIQPGFEGSIAPAVIPQVSPAEAHLAPMEETAAADAGRPGHDLAAVVPDLARLGVPDADATRVGMVLNQLAHRLARGEADWPLLREAMELVMAYPPLARRVAPLLVRYLGVAA